MQVEGEAGMKIFAQLEGENRPNPIFLIKDAKLTTFWRGGHSLLFEEVDKLKDELGW